MAGLGASVVVFLVVAAVVVVVVVVVKMCGGDGWEVLMLFPLESRGLTSRVSIAVPCLTSVGIGNVLTCPMYASGIWISNMPPCP